MKLYLMTDCRNVSGLLFGGYGLPPWFDIPPLREQGPRDRMAREAIAVVQACEGEGAKEVYIHEAHPVELWDLPETCRIVRGSNRLLLDESFDALLFVGQHVNPDVAKVADRRGAGLVSLRLNGTPTDELDFVARRAGTLGVPTALVTGEAAVIAEAVDRLGQSGVTGVATDSGSYGGLADAVPKALAAVRDGSAPVIQPPPGPYRLDVEFSTRFHAERADRFTDFSQTGETTIRVEKKGFEGIFESYLRLGIILDSTSLVLPRLMSRNEKSK